MALLIIVAVILTSVVSFARAKNWLKRPRRSSLSSNLVSIRERLRALRSGSAQILSHEDVQRQLEAERLERIEQSGMAHNFGVHNIRLANEAVYAQRRNVALTLATDLDPRHLYVFLESFVTYCTDARLVVFVEEDDRVFQRWNSRLLARYELVVELVYFRKRDSTVADLYITVFRWFLMEAYLSAFASIDNIETVLHIDARDVAFQWNLFDVLSEGGPSAVHVFEENRRELIGRSKFNYWSMLGCTDRRLVDRSHDKVSINAGVVGGNILGMRMLIGRMTSALTHSADSAKCNDQGGLNGLVHSGQIDELLIVHTHENGPVLHVSVERWDRYELSEYVNARGQVVTATSGQVLAVVHQYDRIDALTRHFFERYPVDSVLDDFDADEVEFMDDEKLRKQFEEQLEAAQKDEL
jgi:hypothetical protein